MDQIKITQLENGDKIDFFYLVDTAQVRKKRDGSSYLSFVFKDKSGKINANFWSPRPGELGMYAANDIVRVKGEARLNGDRLEITVNEIRKKTSEDNVDVTDFIKSAPYPAEVMYNTILQYVSMVKNEDMRKLTEAIYADYKDKLMTFPAAISFHHAELGGLLHHTVNMVKNAYAIKQVYKYLNLDLLICGAAIHDIGKIAENEENEFGLLSGHTVDGELMGHLVGGAYIVKDYARKLGTDPEVERLLTHMILSHHGKLEYGSPVVPKFPEAMVLNVIDDLDAKLYEMEDALGRTNPGEISERVFAFDNAKLYRSELNEVGEFFEQCK